MQISWQAQHFRKVRFSQGLNCVAGAALSKGQVQMSWQAQHFRKVNYRFRGRRGTFARSSKDFVAGAALSQGHVQNSFQAPRFRKVRYRCRGRRAFARSSAEFVAGAALWQGQVQNSWQAQHFRKVKFTIRGRCSTFARSGLRVLLSCLRVAMFEPRLRKWTSRSTFVLKSCDFGAAAKVDFAYYFRT